jgi:uracil-DNA glycosylase
MGVGRFNRLLEALAQAGVPERACNQYSRLEGDLRANTTRRSNLKRYLEDIDAIWSVAAEQPRSRGGKSGGSPAALHTLLVGEAPSYRGGRLTGIPFVSESLMLCGVDHSRGRILDASRGYRKATISEKPSTEASATMVWGTIRSIEPLPMLWNAFPFHPFNTGNARSNRMPTARELAIGAPFIEMLLQLFDIHVIIAVGNQAAASLTKLGVAHKKVRHPSQGGKQLFVAGVQEIVG